VIKVIRSSVDSLIPVTGIKTVESPPAGPITGVWRNTGIAGGGEEAGFNGNP